MPNSLSRPTLPRLQGPALAALAGSFALLALALMWWRWGGTVEDSLAYYNTARYLRGEIPLGELRAPFPYRLLVPALAALAPGELHHSFATLNWLFISAAAVMIALTVQRLQLGSKRAIIGGLLLIVSVPTIWYAPYLLVDPGAICARAAFVLAVVSGQPWLAAAAGLAATAVREENIVLLLWLLAARQISLGAGLLALAAAGGWLLAVRWWLITGLPSYVWAPSLQTVARALADWRSLASIAAAVSLVLPLGLLGMRQAPPALRPLKSLLLLLVLPPLYAALSVRVDGRAVWSLYPLLIPFAMCWRLPARPTGAAADGAGA